MGRRDAGIVGASRTAESWAIVAAGAAFVVAGVVGFAWMAGERHPLAGADSVGNRAAIMSAVLGAAAFAAAYLAGSGHATHWRRSLPRVKRAVDCVGLALAHGGIVYLGTLFVAETFQAGFVGLDVDAFAGSLLAAIAAGVDVYVCVVAGSRVTTRSLSVLVMATLLVGVLMSMLTAADPEWWHLHFSELGNHEGRSAYAFNGTLLLAGIVVTTLANYVSRDIERGLRARGIDPGRRATALAWLFAGIGFGLMVAGLVPDAVSRVVHVGGASGMVVMFAAFAVTVMLAVPGLGRVLQGLTIAMLAGIVLAVVLWVPFGYYNLTGVEFAAAGIVFFWLAVFVRNIAVYADGTDGDVALVGHTLVEPDTERALPEEPA